MAFAPSAALPRSAVPKIAQPAKGSKRSFWSHLAEAIEKANQRRVEREIARYLGTHKFTDETEREIERRFFGSNR